MDEFPRFMRNPANAVASHQQSKGVEGYVFDGVDRSQIINQVTLEIKKIKG